jgi:hypothetical protein
MHLCRNTFALFLPYTYIQCTIDTLNHYRRALSSRLFINKYQKHEKRQQGHSSLPRQVPARRPPHRPGLLS